MIIRYIMALQMSEEHRKQDMWRAVLPFLSSMLTLAPLFVNMFTMVSLSGILKRGGGKVL